ncbi:MAG TPA: O-methyltransferase, partial [Bacteroidetes bacterium]|nr:O-methyltransferase [Bacteroidota bacterium]
MDFLPPQIHDYIIEHSEKESDLLFKLNRETHLKAILPQMLSGHPQGLVLKMFSNMIRPKTILEIGTYTGYSAICLAEGLDKDGILHTIDNNEELYERAGNYFEKAGFKNKIIQHLGNAKNIIPDIKCQFDLIFIDADKQSYSEYFDLIINKLNTGGIIIADNVLWSGRVTEKNKDSDTKAIDRFNK